MEPRSKSISTCWSGTLNSGFGFARTDKIGDAVYAGNGRFYVLERDSSTPDDPAIGHKYIFEIDITHATNLLAEGAPEPKEGLTWEQHSAERPE